MINAEHGSKWFGGYGGKSVSVSFPGHPFQPSFTLSLMTATASIYTATGFVIAADGRQAWQNAPTRDEKMLSLESNIAQKIFSVENEDMSLAYAATGDIANQDRSFDITVEIRKQVKSLSCERFTNCYDYIRTVAAGLEKELVQLKMQGKIEDYPSTQVHFIGYFKGSPCWFNACFFNSRNYLNALCRVDAVGFSGPGHYALSGSPSVNHIVSSGDVAKHTKPIRSDTSLEEAVVFAKWYVEACASPLASETDRFLIGGHTHIASITPENGFKWRIWPKSI